MNKYSYSEQELIEKLAELRQIEPKQDWVIFCREKLIAEAEMGEEISEPEENKGKIAELLTFIRGSFLAQFALRPAVIMAAIFLIIFSTSIYTISAANGSLPGDRLFPVKIALEQARLLATPSAEGKAELQSEIISTRLSELDQVMKSNEPISAKQSKIEAAVNNLQKHFLTAKDDLPKLDNSTPKKVVELAKKIDASATEAVKALNQAKLSISGDNSKNLSEKIADAADAVDKASTKALEVMVSKQGDLSQEEILALLGEKIQNTQDKITNLQKSVAEFDLGKKLPINASIILDESDKAVIQAKVSLEKNDVNGVLETLRVANEMVNSAQKLMDSTSIDQGPGETQPSNDKTNATTTPASEKPTSQSDSATTTSILIELPAQDGQMPVLNITVQGTTIGQE